MIEYNLSHDSLTFLVGWRLYCRSTFKFDSARMELFRADSTSRL